MVGERWKGLVILDMDGVIRDSSQATHLAMREGFASFGVNYPFEARHNWRLRGIGKYSDNLNCISAFMAAILEGADMDAILEDENAELLLDGLIARQMPRMDMDRAIGIREKYSEVFASERVKPLVVLYPRVIEAMARLNDNGYKLAILSMAQRSTIERDLPRQLLARIEVVLGREEVTKKKPHPEGIHRIIEQTGSARERTYFVGDSQSDIQAARNAGCIGIGVLSGMSTRKMLEQEHPHAIFKDLDEFSVRLCDGGV